MKQRFDKPTYGRRWQAETVFSMIKRRLGSALGARSYWPWVRALTLKAITHNILIVLRAIEVFYRASLTPLPPINTPGLREVTGGHVATTLACFFKSTTGDKWYGQTRVSQAGSDVISVVAVRTSTGVEK